MLYCLNTMRLDKIAPHRAEEAKRNSQLIEDSIECSKALEELATVGKQWIPTLGFGYAMYYDTKRKGPSMIRDVPVDLTMLWSGYQSLCILGTGVGAMYLYEHVLSKLF